MKNPSFADLKQDLDEACEFLRGFTLARRGYTPQDGIAAIRRVNRCCARMEELFGLASGPHAKQTAASVASARPRVLAAEARLALLRTIS